MSQIKISDKAARAEALEEMAAKVADSAARLPQIQDGTPEQARQMRAERGNPFAPEACELRSIVDVEIPTSRGAIPARCLRRTHQSEPRSQI